MNFLVVAAVLVSGSEPPYARAQVPPDGKIVLTDFGYRDWGPELVHYGLDTKKFVPGKLVLLGPDGRAVPFQVEDGVLAFVASVPKGGSAAYALRPSEGDRSGENTTLKVKKGPDGVEVANEHLALRLPPPGKATGASPPILQWKPAGQEWMGGARFATGRAIASANFRLVREGPACVEVEARYAFAPAGEYVWRIRLSPGMPLAVVVEEFDLGEATKGEDQLVLELHKGWSPPQVAWVGGSGEQQMPPLVTSAYSSFVDGKRKAKLADAPVGGVGEAPQPVPPEKGLVLLEAIVPGGRWGALKGGVQVRDEGGRSVALVPLHVGSWRRAMALFAWHQEGVGIVVGLPLGVRPMRWTLEVSDDFSPFSTHEHDEGLSRTYGRREWGLMAGPGLEVAQPRFGHIGLDRYKDWVVDWPEGEAAKKAYPGGLFRAEHVERLRKSIDRHPAAAVLRDRCLVSGKVEDAVRNARTVIEKLRNPYAENDFFLSGLSNYRKIQLLIFANEAEDALACPDLPADLRSELRRRLALYAHVTSDPDWNPRGSGVHLGNNNMPINRTCALALFAGLLPDHPCFRYWMECLKDFTRFKLASQFSPHGESLECPCYQLYAPHGGLNIALNVLRNRGLADPVGEGILRKNLEYLANLTMPDPRWGGARIIPGMGNSSNLQESAWAVCVATFLDTDPAFAGWCGAMFRAAGAKFGTVSTGVTCVGHPMYYLPDVPETPVKLATTFMPAYGVVFRSRAGTPDETAMLFRAGANWGHWDSDPLNVILYGRGAPLSPGTGYQYYGGAGVQGNAVYHNQVKVGRRDLQEVFGRVDGTVEDYGFAPGADYAVAERYYPPEIFADGKGEMRWRRHVLFLKSDRPGADCFVMRDTFPGGEGRSKWWTWLNLGLPDKVSVDGRAFEKDKVPVEKVIPESQMPGLSGSVVEMDTDFGASTRFLFGDRRDARVRAVLQYPGSHGAQEVKTVLEVLAGPGQEYFYAVVPGKGGETSMSRPGEGVMKLVTSEGTDYAFVSEAPVRFDRDGVLFEGRAGAVRISADRVTVSLLSGTGRIGYKGRVFEGHGPFEKVVALKDLKPGVEKVEGGYEKRIVSVDLGGGVRVRGEGPFEAKLEGGTIRIRAKGRARVLRVTQPPFIVRPQLWIDGQERMASWTDYPASGWGTYRNTWLMALSAPEGDHELVVKDFRFPPVWARPFEPRIAFAVRRDP